MIFKPFGLYPEEAKDFLRHRITQAAHALEYANSILTELAGPEDTIRTTVAADLHCDRWNFSDGEALALVQSALSITINREAAEHVRRARDWLLQYGLEQKEQLALLSRETTDAGKSETVSFLPAAERSDGITGTRGICCPGAVGHPGPEGRS